MRFNGVDVRDVSGVLSVKREIPPGTATRKIHTMAGMNGETVSGVSIEQGEYVAEINIAAHKREEAWQARALLAAWATTDEPAALEPEFWPGVAYDAILASISPPEFVGGGFATLRLTFTLPRPIAYSVIPQGCAGSGAARMIIGGTANARPTIRQTFAAALGGVSITLDGKPLLSITDGLTEGQVVEMDTKLEKVTIDGENGMHRVDALETDWRPGFTPGVHEIASTDGGLIEVGWRDEWL